MIYTTCRYAPVEMMAGFGVACERLDPVVSGFSCAEECSHANLCSFAKAVIEEVHENNIRELILTDCCDAMRRTYDVLQENAEMDFLYLLSLPHKRTDAEIRLFAEDLKELKNAYEKYSGIAFDVNKALEAYQKQAVPSLPEKPYIRVSGAHGEKTLLKETEKIFSDLAIINETCTGTRYLSSSYEKEKNFFEWYAEALLSQSLPCMRMYFRGGRNNEENDNLKGTIFHTIKFCDYYSFEYMKEKENNTIPLLKVETDTTSASEGQLKTRLEAFREEIGLKKEIQMKKANGKIYVAGVDSGSASTDAVVMDADQRILGKAVVPTGAGAEKTAELALQQALKKAGIQKSDLSAVVSTGYGRDDILKNATSVTEITCHAKGAHYLNPDARTVIDIGGQDSKVIRIDENGNVENFQMNDKCAAGTGRFLEMQARTLEMSMEEMSQKGLEWKKDLTISSMCTVFAESEVVSLIAKNESPADIIHGLNKAIASKTASLIARVGGKEIYIMTGGVAQNAGVVKCLEERIKAPIFVSPYAQVCGSIGAALIALDQIRKG